MSKHIIIDKKDLTFEKIQSATNKLVNLVRPTFGPASHKVIIDKFNHKMVVDDGVQIARDFELDDPVENAIVRKIREVLITTNDREGDGTTGAALILQAIINIVGRKGSFNGRQIELELKKGFDELKESLRKSATPIETKEDIRKVARISFDDPEFSEMIADLYFDLGKEAVITTSKSDTMETTFDKPDGLSLASGYISPFMVNNPERMETEMEKVHILLTDYRLTEASDIQPIMEKMAAKGKKILLVIAENVEQHALATLVINLPHVINPQTKTLGTFMSVAIALPNILDRKQLIHDLALITGGTAFGESTGTQLENLELDDLGYAEKVIVRREETIIIGPAGEEKDITKATGSIRVAIENENNKRKKDALQARLGLFTNKIAVIKVGAPTEQAYKALKYKVEDTINSVKSAYKHGVVCGAGLALARSETSSAILNEALKYPARQLFENMNMEDDAFILDEEGNAYNVVTHEGGPFLEVGVIDPVDVLIAGVESAVSIAGILLTSSGMIIECPDDPK